MRASQCLQDTTEVVTGDNTNNNSCVINHPRCLAAVFKHFLLCNDLAVSVAYI